MARAPATIGSVAAKASPVRRFLVREELMKPPAKVRRVRRHSRCEQFMPEEWNYQESAKWGTC
jgi:hypothetical protein